MANETARINMVKQQLRTGDVLQETILDLFEEIPRKSFVPEAMQPFAYSDMQLPLAHDQRMMTPLEEGQILQALELTGNEYVLEVGTGTGYLSALLSRKCRELVSVDYYQEFISSAAKKLDEYQCSNVTLIQGDASQGWLDKAPYDVVILTGALEEISETLKLQVLPGGKLVAIIGKDPIMQCWLYTLDHNGEWHEKMLFETNIPPLIVKYKPNEFVF